MAKQQKLKTPRTFRCPSCGMQTISVKIEMERKQAIVNCSNCHLEKDYDENISILTEPVDIYGMLIDDFDVKTT